MLPNLAWGVGASVGVSRLPFTLGIDGQYWGPQREPSHQRSTAGADFERYSGGLRGCYRLVGGRPALDACAGAELILVRGHGYGVTHERSGSQTWLAPTLGIGLSYGLTPRLALVGQSELSFPIVRHDFVLTGIGLVYRLPPVAEMSLGSTT